MEPVVISSESIKESSPVRLRKTASESISQIQRCETYIVATLQAGFHSDSRQQINMTRRDLQNIQKLDDSLTSKNRSSCWAETDLMVLTSTVIVNIRIMATTAG
jgi:hypothetical protein